MYIKFSVCLVFLSSFLFIGLAYGQTNLQTKQNGDYDGDDLTLGFKTNEGLDETVSIPKDQLIFNIESSYEQDQFTIQSMNVGLNSSMNNVYEKIQSQNSDSTVVIYPAFTQAAYEKGGFYDYYNKKCDVTCLTLPIPEKLHGSFSANEITLSVLVLLHYTIITDIDVDKNPRILQNYNKVIVLHNEYVTKNEFNAITNHPNVVFLFPNALYSEITTNYEKNTFTLVKGHGYPNSNIKNGFNWQYDNSKYEYDVKCNNWNFYKKGNYTMLNCYPEFKVLYGLELLRELGSNDPSNILGDITNWIRYSNSSESSNSLLHDFDIPSTHIPTWVLKPANMVINGDITKNDFDKILSYLYDQKLLD